MNEGKGNEKHYSLVGQRAIKRKAPLVAGLLSLISGLLPAL
jgi:hypothetical protein